MIELQLSAQEIQDICEALDDPGISEWHKQKLLVLRMHDAGAAHGFIIKCLRLSPTTIVCAQHGHSPDGVRVPCR